MDFGNYSGKYFSFSKWNNDTKPFSDIFIKIKRDPVGEKFRNGNREDYIGKVCDPVSRVRFIKFQLAQILAIVLMLLQHVEQVIYMLCQNKHRSWYYH